jgi:hypothetical protein
MIHSKEAKALRADDVNKHNVTLLALNFANGTSESVFGLRRDVLKHLVLALSLKIII